MDVENYFRFVLALVFVLGLIWLLALTARRFGLGYPINKSRVAGTRRVQIVETAPVDGRRRLILVRRDNVEHLLILGQNTETVIETGIPITMDTDANRPLQPDTEESPALSSTPLSIDGQSKNDK